MSASRKACNTPIATGAPASAIQAYLKALGDHEDLDKALQAGDTFDMIVSYRRAATGERQAGKLLYAGLERPDSKPIQLMRWGDDGQFFEASGMGEQRSGLLAPVPGPIGSRYGMRRHPLLRYKRMHAGVDYRARYGTPIVALAHGRVTSAGRAGGCGNAVRIQHEGNLATRACHMSRMAVSRGQYVKRGQVIGYVGSTGLSTGPHLHYEVRVDGVAEKGAGLGVAHRLGHGRAETVQADEVGRLLGHQVLQGETAERYRVIVRQRSVHVYSCYRVHCA